MNLVMVNLSHYWKRPALILWQGMLLLMLLPSIPMLLEQRVHTWMTPLYWPLFWMLIMGTMTATYQTEILSKPLSYTLPGHRCTVRKLLFGFNLFSSLLSAAMVLLLYPRDFTSRCCAAVLVLAFGQILFWVGVWCSYRSRNQAIVGFVFPILLFGPTVMDSFPVGLHWLQPMVVAVVAVISGIVSYLAWRLLGRASFFQACCGRHYLGFTGAFSPGQVKKAQRERFKAISAQTDEKLSRLGRFFVEKIARNRNQPFASFIYGVMYQTLGPVALMTLKSHGTNLIFMTLVFLLFGYYGKTGNLFIWLMYIFSILGTDLQVHSTLLLIRGRMERFVSALMSLVLLTLLGLATASVGIAGTILLTPYMPTFPIRGFIAEFHALSWQSCYLFIIGAPVVALLRLLFWGKRCFVFISIVLGAGLMGASFPLLMNIRDNLISISWVAILVVLILAWSAFAVYLYRVCFHKNLAIK